MVFFLRNPNLRSMDIKFIYLKSVVLQDILYFSTCSLQCIYYNNSNVLNYYNTILYCTILYYYTWLLSLPVQSVLCRIIIRWRRIILTGMRGNEVLASSSHSISISGKGSVGRSRILRCRSCGNHIHKYNLTISYHIKYGYLQIAMQSMREQCVVLMTRLEAKTSFTCGLSVT